MLDHQRDNLVVAELTLSQAEFAIDWFALAQEITRLEFHLSEQVRELFLAERLDVIVNLIKVHAAIAQKPIHLAAFCTGWSFVNANLVYHKLPYFVLGT